MKENRVFLQNHIHSEAKKLCKSYNLNITNLLSSIINYNIEEMITNKSFLQKIIKEIYFTHQMPQIETQNQLTLKETKEAI